MPIRAPEGAPSRSPHATEVERRRTFAIISHPDAGKTTLTEKLLAVRRGDPARRPGQGQARPAHHPLGLDGDRARARHFRGHLGDDLRVRRPRLQPARYARPRGLLRGHLSHADRGRFRGHGDRRRQGHRGAHPQAVRGLPAARHPDHHLHQQDGPREPRPVRSPRRDREDAGARHRADHLAGRARARFRRHHRYRDRRRAPARRRRRLRRQAARNAGVRGGRAQSQSRRGRDRRASSTWCGRRASAST